MNLQKIREAYWENLRLYNELFPIHSVSQRRNWRINSREELSDIKEISDIKNIKISEDIKEFLSLSKILEEKEKGFEKRADQSGNPQIWRRGDPLDNLSQGLRERIERALNFGI